MPPYIKEPLPVIFRPPKAGLVLFWIIYVCCLIAAILELIYVIHTRQWKNLISVFIQLIPCLLAWVVLARKYAIEKDGLRVRYFRSAHFFPWTSIRFLDQTRQSFLLYTNQGGVIPSLITPKDSSRLMRLILQYGRLQAVPQKLPWYVTARFEPASADIKWKSEGTPSEEKER